eukprot:290960_1
MIEHCETTTLKESATTNDTKNGVDNNKRRSRIFCLYCMMAICAGVMEPLGPTLYIELQDQLSISESAIAFSFTTRSIAAIISSIISGKVVDCCIESHRYIAFISIVFIVSIIYLPFVQHIYALHVVFGVVGFTYNAHMMVIFIYVLRLYSEEKRQDAGHRLYIILVMYGITKTVYPLLVQLCIQYSSEYVYALYSVLIIFVVEIVLLLIFTTPTHDKLRTIKAELNNEPNNKTQKAEQIFKTLNSDIKHRLYEGTIVFILSVIVFSYSAMQEYFTTFVIVYCKDTHIGEEYGRYLMSTYFCGQLLYRIMNALIEKCKNIPSQYQMLLSLCMITTVSFIFLFFYDNVIWIFIVWALCGFFSAALIPEIEIWTELITPVTGNIEILYTLTNAAGEVVAVFGFGLLLQRFSVLILRYLIFAFSGNGLLFVIINIVLYACYLRNKHTLCKYDTV